MIVSPAASPTTGGATRNATPNMWWPEDAQHDLRAWFDNSRVRCSGRTAQGSRCRIARTMTGMIVVAPLDQPWLMPPIMLCGAHHSQVEAIEVGAPR